MKLSLPFDRYFIQMKNCYQESLAISIENTSIFQCLTSARVVSRKLEENYIIYSQVAQYCYQESLAISIKNTSIFQA